MSKTFEHDGCVGCKYEHFTSTSSYCQGCKQNAVDKYTRMTNADIVRSMTNDELAEFLNNVHIYMNDEESMLSLLIEDKRVNVGWNYEDIVEWLESEIDK